VVSQTFIAALFWYHRDQFLKLVCFFPSSPHQENTTRDNKQFSTRVFCCGLSVFSVSNRSCLRVTHIFSTHVAFWYVYKHWQLILLCCINPV
jgi:hypothetical protein